QYSCAGPGPLQSGMMLTFAPYTCGQVTFTPTRTNTVTTTRTATPTPHAMCGTGSDYVISPASGATIVTGTTLVTGSQCNFCSVGIALPFTYNLYGIPFTSVIAGGQGVLGFGMVAGNYTGPTTCLPDPNNSNYAIYPFSTGSGLDMSPNVSPTLGLGIYKSTSG